jgi:tripartite-type tricarboxylate transporter receptor subunit TctC
LRALAVSGLKPVDSLPDLPTIASVIPEFEAIQWYGIVAPARTPAPVIAMLNEEINKALATPALKARLDAEGAEAAPMSPNAFGTMIGREIARWKPVIEQAHMQPE